MSFTFLFHVEWIPRLILCLERFYLNTYLERFAAQRVKNLPAVQEIPGSILDWEGHAEGTGSSSSILPGLSHGHRSLADYSSVGLQNPDSTKRLTYTFKSKSTFMQAVYTTVTCVGTLAFKKW